MRQRRGGGGCLQPLFQRVRPVTGRPIQEAGECEDSKAMDAGDRTTWIPTSLKTWYSMVSLFALFLFSRCSKATRAISEYDISDQYSYPLGKSSGSRQEPSPSHPLPSPFLATRPRNRSPTLYQYSSTSTRRRRRLILRSRAFGSKPFQLSHHFGPEKKIQEMGIGYLEQRRTLVRCD